MNIAIFASGRGTNFEAIIKAIKKKRIRAQVALLVCDNPEAGAIKIAQRERIKVALIKRQEFTREKDFGKRIIRHLKENNIGLIVMAGFMRMLGAELVHRYKNKILNIHPALLPSFKGAQGLKDAFRYGVKVTGVTVHFADEKMDHGPIILQEPVVINEDDTLETLEAKIHRIEHKLYPEAIKLFIEGKLKIKERKVKIMK